MSVFGLEFSPMTGASYAFVDKGCIMMRTALRSLIQFLQQNNVVQGARDTASPVFYCHLLLVPKKSLRWRPVNDLSSIVAVDHFTEARRKRDRSVVEGWKVKDQIWVRYQGQRSCSVP